MKIFNLLKRFFNPFDNSFKVWNSSIGGLSLSLFFCSKFFQISIYFVISLAIIVFLLLLILLYFLFKKRFITFDKSLRSRERNALIDRLNRSRIGFIDYTKYCGILLICLLIGYGIVLYQENLVKNEKEKIQHEIADNHNKLREILSKHQNLSKPTASTKYNADSLNDKHSQTALGYMYFKGFEGKIKPDYNLAKHYYNLASNNNHSFAQFQLGYMYHKGYGGEANKDFSRLYLIKSADNGFSKAQNLIGQMYAYGDGVPANGVLAEKYLLLASESDESDAQHLLAMLYHHNKMNDKFYFWMERAALNGNINCQDFVASHYINKGKYNQAIEMYKNLVNNNAPSGYLGLGDCYLNGYGFNKDIKLAEEFYKKGYSEGADESEYKLANFYFSINNYNKAEYWCDLAISKETLNIYNKNALAVMRTTLNALNYGK